MVNDRMKTVEYEREGMSVNCAQIRSIVCQELCESKFSKSILPFSDTMHTDTDFVHLHNMLKT